MQNTQKSIFEDAEEMLEHMNTAGLSGRVIQVIGLVVECTGMAVPVGSLCMIHSRVNNEDVESEVVGFRENRVLLMPFGEMRGISAGDDVLCVSRKQTVGVGMSLLGRVIDARGNPIDGMACYFLKVCFPCNNYYYCA